ncbi:MAG TPA: hypothetical protein VE152_01865 [Acidimicrobiales bacterium]|nr:hypothetical protein [Acidimicrobiales bacterium]
MTWIVLVFNAVMLAWLIGGLVSASNTVGNCVGQGCQAAGTVGTTIGAGLIIGLWVAGDVILGVLWLVTRPRGRSCPACGEFVKRGRTVCKAYGLDLSAHARGEKQPYDYRH